MKNHPIPFFLSCKFLLLSCGFLFTFSSFAAPEWAGVRYLPTLKSGSTTLTLNGAGISYKAITKQFTVGLYVPSVSNNVAELINMPGAKQIRLVMLAPLRADELGSMLGKGIKTNSSTEEYRALIRNAVEMGQIFAKLPRMNSGDTLLIDFQPERGVQFLLNDRPIGNVIQGSAFFNALLKSWVGERPYSGALKNEMLGVKEKTPLDVLDN